jgi:hypothetical protein
MNGYTKKSLNSVLRFIENFYNGATDIPLVGLVLPKLVDNTVSIIANL